MARTEQTNHPRPVGHGRSPAVDSLLTARAQLAAAHSARGGGVEHCRALATATDDAIRAFVANESGQSWAVVAVGGYGRGELSPHSDIDVVVLRGGRNEDVQRVANSVFYSLWDAGLDTSPSVRSVAESAEVAATDLSTLTSYLTIRHLVGDEALTTEVRRRVLADARRKGSRHFLQHLLQERQTRLQRAAETLFGLEPNLKAGRGGLRDLHELIWGSLVALDTGDPAEIARRGFLGLDEVAPIVSAFDHISTIRNRLHYASGRKTDQLHFAYQQDLARFLGFNGASGFQPIELMMRDLNSKADAIARSTAGFWEHIEDELLVAPPSLFGAIRGRLAGRPDATAPAWSARDGRLVLPSETKQISGPDSALAVLAAAASRGVRVGHDFVRNARLALADTPRPFAWTESTTSNLMAVLRAGDAAEALIEAASAAGLLSGLIPEWESIRFLAHHDVYHLHTVDHHTALVVAEIGKLRTGESEADQFTVSVADQLEDFDSLLLGALLHDIGKGTSGDHSSVGANLTRQLGTRIGLSPDRIANAEFIVRHHLLLVRAATRRDLDDEALIAQIARTVGTMDRLRALYLLTYADSTQTGPAAWTDWKASLVRELFLRVSRVLGGSGVSGIDNIAARVAARVNELANLVGGATEVRALTDFLSRMPPAYVLGQTADAVRAHFDLMSTPADGPARLAFGRAADGLHDELTLIAPDQPGLLWRVCGTIALHGVSILEARIFTDSAGTCLDVFRLEDAFEPGIPVEKREQIARDVALVLDGRLSLGYRLARKLKAYRDNAGEPPTSTRVTVDNIASERYTIVEVHARDRLGLLYTITRALSDLQLDIDLAKLATHGREAIDTFYVLDANGQKTTDPDHAREIERALLYEIESLAAD